MTEGYFKRLSPDLVDQREPRYHPHRPCCVGAHLASVFCAPETDYLRGADAWASAVGGNRAHAILLLRNAGAAFDPFSGARWPTPPARVFARVAKLETLPDLVGADLEHVDLHEADLRGADLSRAYLEHVDLHEADLRGADLSRAYLKHANLRTAKLDGTILHGAVLRHADLTGATLDGTDLRGADLSYADLSDLDLSTTRLNRANFFAANVTGTRVNMNDMEHITLLCTGIQWARECQTVGPDS